MPLASGSFPYRPRARVAPKEDGDGAGTGEDKDGPQREDVETARDPVSSQDAESRAELDAALDVAHEEADSTYAAPPTVAAPPAAEEGHGHWLPPTVAGATKDGALGAFAAPHLGKRALIPPLDQRPADQHKIRIMTSSAPLIGASTAFAAIAFVLGYFANRYCWLDYADNFHNVIRGVFYEWRYSEYANTTIKCTTTIPSGIDPDVIDGCVDIGPTAGWQLWLYSLNKAAWEVCVFAFILSLFSSRHLRWWIARFTSPYAPIPCLVGDITGSCGHEPACLHYGCRDCGFIFTPGMSGFFNLISACMNFGAFGGFVEGTNSMAIYRTEGPWLCITAGGMSLAAALFAFWSQWVVCPVPHVWACDMHCRVTEAWAELDAQSDSLLPGEHAHQGVPHLVASTARRILLVKDKSMARVVAAKDALVLSVRRLVLPPEYHDEEAAAGGGGPGEGGDRPADLARQESVGFLRGQGAKVTTKKSMAATMRVASRRTVDTTFASASPRGMGMSSQSLDRGSGASDGYGEGGASAAAGGEGVARREGGDRMPASPGRLARMAAPHGVAEVDLEQGSHEEGEGGQHLEAEEDDGGRDEADEVSLAVPPPVRAAAPVPAPAPPSGPRGRRVVDEDSMFN